MVPSQRICRLMPEAWVYLLRCRDGSLYTGWTVDLERRFARHQAGIASRYTASRLPVELALAIPMADRTAARREEARIKRLPRDAKLALVSAGESALTQDGVPASATTVFFECEDLDATVTELELAGLEFEHPPVDQPWLWREARLRDPDGNRLCLFHAGENRLNPPWRLPD
jgi:predicted GIY-YIG superfamily endonuclease